MFYGVMGFNYRPDDPQLRSKGYAAIEKSLALDPQSAEAHYARGILIWQPSEAMAASRGARRVPPSAHASA